MKGGDQRFANADALIGILNPQGPNMDLGQEASPSLRDILARVLALPNLTSPAVRSPGLGAARPSVPHSRMEVGLGA